MTFSKQDYIQSILKKYVHCENVIFDDFTPAIGDVTLIMGRSMLTLSWRNYNYYTNPQRMSLKRLFSGKLISVYSENHPTEYPIAVLFYSTRHIVDICDTEVYPMSIGLGAHFEKRINFEIYNSHVDDVQFEYLFLGTNKEYYASAEKVVDRYPNHGILTVDLGYANPKHNNIPAPVENMMGLFDTYVYTKEIFDPAPRIIQECKQFGKNMIYCRDVSIVDGGSVYWVRGIKQPDVIPILNAYEQLQLI